LAFYIVALLLTCCTLSYTAIIPVDNFCAKSWVLFFYGESSMNLVMGVVQSTNIALLGTRLFYERRLARMFKEADQIKSENDGLRFRKQSIISAI
jgi:hypothetical protein